MTNVEANAFGKLAIPGQPFMSPDETAHLSKMYEKASIILEYGSGGSTRIASGMKDKIVFSVESDKEWADKLREEIQSSQPVSEVYIHHVDIGEVGPWGRPLDQANWRKYQRYPLTIWDEPFFNHPDLILIDGRMRCSCLIYAMLRAEKPMTILFDDYTARKMYQKVERIIKPTKVINTMAHFDVIPDMITKHDLGFAVAQFFLGSFHGYSADFYDSADLL